MELLVIQAMASKACCAELAVTCMTRFLVKNGGTSIKQSASGLGKMVRYIEVLFHTSHHFWAEKYCSLYQGLCYVEVR